MTRVLLDDFGAIATLGLRELLEEDCEIVAEPTSPNDLLSRVRKSAPDVVVVDADDPAGLDVAELLSRSAPDVIVIGCSLTEPTLCVFSTGEASYTTELSPQSLLHAVHGR